MMASVGTIAFDLDERLAEDRGSGDEQVRGDQGCRYPISMFTTKTMPKWTGSMP